MGKRAMMLDPVLGELAQPGPGCTTRTGPYHLTPYFDSAMLELWGAWQEHQEPWQIWHRRIEHYLPADGEAVVVVQEQEIRPVLTVETAEEMVTEAVRDALAEVPARATENLGRRMQAALEARSRPGRHPIEINLEGREQELEA